METEGLEFLQFSFRWVNCLLLREIPFQLGLRLWDTYLAEGPRMKEFLIYGLAAFLLTWDKELKQMDFQVGSHSTCRLYACMGMPVQNNLCLAVSLLGYAPSDFWLLFDTFRLLSVEQGSSQHSAWLCGIVVALAQRSHKCLVQLAMSSSAKKTASFDSAAVTAHGFLVGPFFGLSIEDFGSCWCSWPTQLAGRAAVCLESWSASR